MSSFLLDIIVILLLALTIGYCWKLNHKIQVLQNSKKDLTGLVRTFDSALFNAQKSIADLKVASNKSSESLTVYVKKSEELISDLEFITTKAVRISNNLENMIEKAKKHVPTDSKKTTKALTAKKTKSTMKKATTTKPKEKKTTTVKKTVTKAKTTKTKVKKKT